MNKFLSLLIVTLLAGFVWMLWNQHQHKLSTGQCLQCHQSVNSAFLSPKARGKTLLIFYHSTHSLKTMGLDCTACHLPKIHGGSGKRPSEAKCLECHTGAEDKPSNSCEVCHSDSERLSF